MSKAKILGKLRGPIASARERSRNNRDYTEGFWDTKFNSELFQEGLKNKVMLGQLYHPDDDEEYTQIHCDDRSAVVLTDVKKTPDKDYIGTFEILPTKAGQCLRNLLDIGCIFGASSRGISDFDANTFDESVAPNYDLVTFDIVAFPGVKCCRLHEVGAVAESVKTTNKSKVMESLNEIHDSDKFYASFIDEALKAKEGFNDTLQIEDYMALNGMEDITQYADIITVEADGKPYFDDGEHGKHRVLLRAGDMTEYQEGDKFLVDNIYYRKNNYGDEYYITIGDWLRLGD